MENKKTKIAVFGGSFDPITFAHVDIVKNLERKFDGVIVVPSGISPFKTEALGVAYGKVRLKLCKRVFASEKTTVNGCEVKRGGVSYSSDTAKALAKKMKDASLFWVIGSEEVARLHEWHDIDALKTLVTFYVVPRPGFVPAADVLSALKKRKIKIKFAPFTGIDCSSTEVKIDLAFGKPNKYMPSEVYAHVLKTGDFDPYARYADKLYEYRNDYRRIEHSYRTAIRGAELAKLYGGNVTDAVIACILHDVGKAVTKEKLDAADDFSEYPLPTAHAPIGGLIVKKEFPELGDEIARAITVHSTGDEKMTLLDEIVYLADKTESGRNYPSLEKMRFLCEYDRNIAMREALAEIAKLESSGDCVFSRRALEYYTDKCGGAVVPEMPANEKYAVPAQAKSTEKAVDVATEKQPPAPKNDKRSEKRENDGAYAIAHAVAEELSKHKAYNIDIISLEGKTIIADYFVIASATSTTAVRALTDYVEDRLKKQFDIDPNKRDMDREWVALDYGDIIVHIFTDRTREFYNIERLWADSTVKNVERYED